MKRSVEIQNAIVEKKAEMANLKEQGKIAEAYEVLGEVKALKQELDIEKALDEPMQAEALSAKDRAEKKGSAVTAFNKALRGKPLTEAEAALVESTDEKGGYLVPTDEVTKIDELKRSLGNLKQYCDVVPVTTLNGTYTVETEDNGELIDFEEDGEITEGDITFANKEWSVKAQGLIIPISNMLLQDEQANLMAYVNRHFAKRGTRSDNKKIVTVLKTATESAGTDYKAINHCLNKELDPAISASAIILTNQSGYDYLDTLEDSSGKPLMKEHLGNEAYKTYDGKRVIVVSDNDYKSDEGKLEYWVGDMFEFVKFFDRRVYEVKISEHAGFTKNRTLLRCIQRTDAICNDEKAGKRVVITVGE